MEAEYEVRAAVCREEWRLQLEEVQSTYTQTISALVSTMRSAASACISLGVHVAEAACV